MKHTVEERLSAVVSCTKSGKCYNVTQEERLFHDGGEGERQRQAGNL
jgi:hypothetical protein